MNEVDPMDRVYDLVTELCESDCGPREILDTARDAIREWRQRKLAREERSNDKL